MLCHFSVARTLWTSAAGLKFHFVASAQHQLDRLLQQNGMLDT